MEAAQECREYQKKVDHLWSWFSDNGTPGAETTLYEHECLLNKAKGFFWFIGVASAIGALGTIAGFLEKIFKP